jgi:hypothetical protein
LKENLTWAIAVHWRQFDRYVDDCFARRGKTFCILTDGDWDLKMCLLQETRKKDIARAPHYMTYFVHTPPPLPVRCRSLASYSNACHVM